MIPKNRVIRMETVMEKLREQKQSLSLEELYDQLENYPHGRKTLGRDVDSLSKMEMVKKKIKHSHGCQTMIELGELGQGETNANDFGSK